MCLWLSSWIHCMWLVQTCQNRSIHCVIKTILCEAVYQRIYLLSSPFFYHRCAYRWCIESRMENTVSAAEVDPLKREEDGGEMPSSTELKKKSCKEVLGFAKLTHWRTAVFFLSLFLCLTIVFAFSFIIPCPVRPQYLISWSRTFPEAGLHKCRFVCFGWLRNHGRCVKTTAFSTATYEFLAIEDTNRDKVNDILFVLKSSEGSQNNTCTDAGMTRTSHLKTR